MLVKVEIKYQWQQTHSDVFHYEVAQQHTLMNMEMEMSGARDEETKGMDGIGKERERDFLSREGRL